MPEIEICRGCGLPYIKGENEEIREGKCSTCQFLAGEIGWAERSRNANLHIQMALLLAELRDLKAKVGRG